jgi:hypothetical protein
MEELTFETAYKKLKDIEANLKADRVVDVDKIIEMQEEAKKYHDFCMDLLKKHVVNEDDKENI